MRKTDTDTMREKTEKRDWIERKVVFFLLFFFFSELNSLMFLRCDPQQRWWKPNRERERQGWAKRQQNGCERVKKAKKIRKMRMRYKERETVKKLTVRQNRDIMTETLTKTETR